MNDMTVEDVLDYLDNICVCHGCECWEDHDWGGCYRTTATGKMACDLRDEAVEVLRKVVFRANVPSKGKWQITSIKGETWGVCSNCNFKQKAGELNFCPNCGADMRGE